MKRLTPKTSGFSSISIFVKQDRSHELIDSETLPEGFLFGVEVPDGGGTYSVISHLGSFVLRVPESGPISVLWSTRTGSFGDGTYRLNNSTGINASTTFVEEEMWSFQSGVDGLFRTDRYYDSLNEYDDFFILMPMTRNLAGVTGTGVLKLEKDFNSYVEIFDTNLGPNPFDYVLLNNPECAVFFDYVDEGGVIVVDFENETIVNHPAPEMLADTNGAYGIVQVGKGEVAVFNDKFTSVYRINPDKTPTHLGNFTWTNGGVGTNTLYWGYIPMYNVKWDDETIYVSDFGVGNKRRVRAIDATTYELRWDLTDTGVGFQNGAYYVEEFMSILDNGNIAGVDMYDFVSGQGYLGRVKEYSKVDGSEVNVWDGITRGLFDAVTNCFVSRGDTLYIQQFDKVFLFNLQTGVIEEVILDPSFNLYARNNPVLDEGGVFIVDTTGSDQSGTLASYQIYTPNGDTQKTVYGTYSAPYFDSLMTVTDSGIYRYFRVGDDTTGQKKIVRHTLQE